MLHIFGSRTDALLKQSEAAHDCGLIRADLATQSVLIGGANFHLIDLDCGGYGYWLFELATTLLRFHRDEDFVTLKAALLGAYTAV